MQIRHRADVAYPSGSNCRKKKPSRFPYIGFKGTIIICGFIQGIVTIVGAKYCSLEDVNPLKKLFFITYLSGPTCAEARAPWLP